MAGGLITTSRHVMHFLTEKRRHPADDGFAMFHYAQAYYSVKMQELTFPESSNNDQR